MTIIYKIIYLSLALLIFNTVSGKTVDPPLSKFTTTSSSESIFTSEGGGRGDLLGVVEFDTIPKRNVYKTELIGKGFKADFRNSHWSILGLNVNENNFSSAELEFKPNNFLAHQPINLYGYSEIWVNYSETAISNNCTIDISLVGQYINKRDSNNTVNWQAGTWASKGVGFIHLNKNLSKNKVVVSIDGLGAGNQLRLSELVVKLNSNNYDCSLDVEDIKVVSFFEGAIPKYVDQYTDNIKALGGPFRRQDEILSGKTEYVNLISSLSFDAQSAGRLADIDQYADDRKIKIFWPIFSDVGKHAYFRIDELPGSEQLGFIEIKFVFKDGRAMSYMVTPNRVVQLENDAGRLEAAYIQINKPSNAYKLNLKSAALFNSEIVNYQEVLHKNIYLDKLVVPSIDKKNKNALISIGPGSIGGSFDGSSEIAFHTQVPEDLTIHRIIVKHKFDAPIIANDACILNVTLNYERKSIKRKICINYGYQELIISTALTQSEYERYGDLGVLRSIDWAFKNPLIQLKQGDRNFEIMLQFIGVKKYSILSRIFQSPIYKYEGREVLLSQDELDRAHITHGGFNMEFPIPKSITVLDIAPIPNKLFHLDYIKKMSDSQLYFFGNNILKNRNENILGVPKFYIYLAIITIIFSSYVILRRFKNIIYIYLSQVIGFLKNNSYHQLFAYIVIFLILIYAGQFTSKQVNENYYYTVSQVLFALIFIQIFKCIKNFHLQRTGKSLIIKNSNGLVPFIGGLACLILLLVTINLDYKYFSNVIASQAYIFLVIGYINRLFNSKIR